MNPNKIAISTYNKIASKYSGLYFNDLSDLPQIDRFLAELKPSSKILDIGCGPGEFTKYLLEKGFDVEGIDLSPEMVKIAKEKVPNGKFFQMDMRTLNYPVNFFDALLVAYSLIHIPSVDIYKTLEGFKKVLKPNGLVFIITQKGQPDQIVDEPLRKSEKMFINFFTKERIANFLNESGFKTVWQIELANNDQNSMSDAIIYTLAKAV